MYVDHFFPDTLKGRFSLCRWYLNLFKTKIIEEKVASLAKVPTIKLLERLHKERFLAQSSSLGELQCLKQAIKRAKNKVLQKCYNSAKKKLIHNWDVEPKVNQL